MRFVRSLRIGAHVTICDNWLPWREGAFVSMWQLHERKGDHEPDQNGFDVERGAAGRDGERARVGLAPRRARALRRRNRGSVLSLVLPSLLSLLLSPGRAGSAADVCRARGRAGCAGAGCL